MDPYGSLRRKEKERSNSNATFSPMESLTNLFRSSNSVLSNSNNGVNNNNNNNSIAFNLQSPLNSPMQSPHSSLGQIPQSPRVGPATSPHSSVNNFGSLGSLSGKKADFIVFSEFSEQKGPVYLNVVPDTINLVPFEGFDLSKYVVKIMSVDFQNKTNDLRTYAKDAQMFFTLTSPNDAHELYAYIHHFSLFDIYARGYVRPLVLSYLTRDPHKVMRSFDKFLAKFSRVTTFLKSKNHLTFEIEFRQRMRDLDYTVEYYKNDQSISDKERDSYIQLINDAKSEMKGIEVLFEQEKKIRDPNFIHHRTSTTTTTDADSIDSDGGGGGSGSGINSLVHNHGGKHSNKNCNQQQQKFKRGVLPHSLETTFGTIYFNENLVLTGEPKLMNALQKTNYLDKPLRTVCELCTPEVYDKFIRKLEKCYNYFSKSSVQTEFDKIDSQSLYPSSTLLTIGETSILNYFFSEEESKHYIRSQKKDIKSKIHKSKMMNIGTMSSYSGSDLSSYLSVESMNDQFGEFSLSPIDENYLRQQNGSTTSLPFMSLVPNPNSSNATANTTPTAINTSTSLLPPPPSPQQQSQQAITLPTSLVPPSLQQQQQPPIPSVPPLTNELSRFKSFSNYMWGASKPEYGKGLLKLVTKYPWIKHAVFSILKGRPVFVVGSHEKKTQILSMVGALAIFVVGYCRATKREAIDLYYNPANREKLKLSDLSWLKLAGVPKTPESTKLPSNVIPYISKIDLDTEEYTGPLYNANNGLIDEILGIKKNWNDNESLYISHIQSMFFDLAIKSFIHYHICCVQPHPFRTDHPLLSSSIIASQLSKPQSLYYSTSELPALSLPVCLTPPDSSLASHMYKSTSAFARKKPPVVPITTRSLSESHLKDHPNNNIVQHSLIPSVIPDSPSDHHSVLTQSSSSTISNNSINNNTNQLQSSTNSQHNNNNNTNNNNNNHSQNNNLANNGNQQNNSPSPYAPPNTPNTPNSFNSNQQSSPSPKQTTSHSSTRYTDPKTLFKRWELHPQDQMIIEYLSEVVKDQQYFEIYNSKNQEMSPSIKLDFTPCQTIDRRGKEIKL